VPADPTAAGRGGRRAVRVVSWNVQRAGPERARRQVRWLAGAAGADVAVLTEVANAPGGDALVAALGAEGFATVVPPAAAGAHLVVLAARGTLAPLAGPHLPVFPQRCVTAVATVRGQRAAVIGVYVPSRGPRARRNEDKRAFQDALRAGLPPILAGLPAGAPVVLTGDLNVVEPGHVPRLPVFGAWEYAFYEHFAAEHGLVDAYRALHPDQVAHSWYGRAGIGYRLDHAFVGSEHLPRLRGCAYRQRPRLAGLSDHAALALMLDLGP
jgi:exodeoxyribonuclease III